MATVRVSVNVNKRELERLIRRAPGEAEKVTRERAGALRKDIQRRMPKKSGKTARNTKEVRRGAYDWAVEIPEVPGRFLIEGTKAHIIRGRPVLRFMGRGGWVFARVVRHPGTKANPFAQEAARAAVHPFAAAVVNIFRGR